MACNMIHMPEMPKSAVLEQHADVLAERGDAKGAAWYHAKASEVRGSDRDDLMPGGDMFLCGDIKVDICHRAGCGRAADLLCDHPMGRGKTCDLAMCPTHANGIGVELDLCEIHFREFAARAPTTKPNPWPPPRMVR